MRLNFYSHFAAEGNLKPGVVKNIAQSFIAMATHSSTLAWKIPWMEKPGRLQSMGLQRVGHDWATSLSFFLSFFHSYFSGRDGIWTKQCGTRLWILRLYVTPLFNQLLNFNKLSISVHVTLGPPDDFDQFWRQLEFKRWICWNFKTQH